MQPLMQLSQQLLHLLPLYLQILSFLVGSFLGLTSIILQVWLSLRDRNRA